MLYASKPHRSKDAPWQMLDGPCDTVWTIGPLTRLPVGAEGESIRQPGAFGLRAAVLRAAPLAAACHELGDPKTPEASSSGVLP
jgi:hypothetical protein